MWNTGFNRDRDSFCFSNQLSIDLWIVFFPVILAVPILTAVLMTGDDELGVQASEWNNS